MMTQASGCPRCGGQLLWNGRGMVCIACSYFTAASEPAPSEKKLPLPRPKKPGDARK